MEISLGAAILTNVPLLPQGTVSDSSSNLHGFYTKGKCSRPMTFLNARFTRNVHEIVTVRNIPPAISLSFFLSVAMSKFAVE